MFRNALTLILLLFSTSLLRAQTGDVAYLFLDLPASVSASGVGGVTVSSMENDLNLTFHNPAKLSPELHHVAEVGYMNYLADIQFGSAAYARKINERSAWMAGVRYIDYGSMLWTSETDEVLGNAYAKDMAFSGTYAWMLSQNWRAGSTVNLVYSVMNEYASFGVAVDLGVYYQSTDRLLSAGLVFRNLGSQLISYQDTYEPMPSDLQLGISRKLAHAPLRFSLTLQDLLRPDLSYLAETIAVSTTETDAGTESTGEKILKHCVFGAEILPSKNFLLSIGYNYRRVSELGLAQRTPFGGMTAGFAMSVGNVRVGASFAKYHLAGSSLQMTLGMNLSKVGL